MTITAAQLDNGASNVDDTGGAGYASNPIALTSGTLLVAFVYNRKQTPTVAQPAITDDAGLSWGAAKSSSTFGAGLSRVTAYAAAVTSTQSGRTVTMGAGTTTNIGLHYWLIELSNAAYLAVGDNTGNDTAPTATSPTAGSLILTFCAADGTPATVTFPSGFTGNGGTIASTTPTGKSRSAYKVGSDVTALWTLSGATTWGCVALTVSDSGGATPLLILTEHGLSV